MAKENLCQYEKLKQLPKMTKEEENRLILLAQNDNQEAMETLIAANIGIIRKVINKFYNPKIPYNDLLQEAILGFIKGIKNFDMTKEYCLSTYIVFYIKQSIQNLIHDCGYDISFSYNEYTNVQKAKIAYNKLISLGLEPTVEELSKVTGINLIKMQHIYVIIRESVHLNKSISSDNDFTKLQEYLMPIQESAEDTLINKDFLEKILKIYFSSGLTQTQIIILNNAFGLFGYPISKLTDIGEKLGLKKAAVHRQFASAIKKLRQNFETYKLIDYLDDPLKALVSLSYYNDWYLRHVNSVRLNIDVPINYEVPTNTQKMFIR